MTRKHVYISGRVQGVWFRAYTEKAARRYGVTGWVKNLPDGRVEAIFEGKRDSVDKMVTWCREEGSPGSYVSNVEVVEEKYRGEYKDFEIRY